MEVKRKRSLESQAELFEKYKKEAERVENDRKKEAKKYKTLKKYITITVIASLGLGSLFAILITDLKTKIFSIVEYLGLEIIWFYISLITIAFLLSYIIMYGIQKTNNVKIINNYAILSFYLIALSLCSSVIIMYSLTPNEIIFDETISFHNANTNENATGANIKCVSKSFDFVKGEKIRCFITGEIPKSILTNQTDMEFTKVNITQYFMDINEDINQLEFKKNESNQNLVINKYFAVELLEKNEIVLSFFISTTDSEITGSTTNDITLINPEFASSKIQQTNNLIYSLLLFSMSFSILAVFGGINSLRQIIQNGNTEQHKQEKEN